MPSLFKSTLEPIIIGSIFALGAVINRRTPNVRDTKSDIEHIPLTADIDCLDAPQFLDPASSSSSASSPPEEPAQRHRGWPRRDAGSTFLELFGRFWSMFPFLPEIWYWSLTYWVYQSLRAFSARTIAGKQPIFDLARAHALQILRLEAILGIDIELAFQQSILSNYPSQVLTMKRIYHSHICIGALMVVYCYTYLPHAVYRRVRNTLALNNAIAFMVISYWRCCPPRLLPPEYGYVDVLHGNMFAADEGSAWTNNRFQLTIAAMPSLHFGTSLFFAVVLSKFSPHRSIRVLAPLWPVVMLITIIATANHYLLDAVVGAVIPFLGWRYHEVWGYLGRVQDWVLKPAKKRMGLLEEGEKRIRE